MVFEAPVPTHGAGVDWLVDLVVARREDDTLVLVEAQAPLVEAQPTEVEGRAGELFGSVTDVSYWTSSIEISSTSRQWAICRS